MRALVSTLAFAWFAAGPAVAQTVSGGPVVARVRLSRETATAVEVLSGNTIGAVAAFGVGRFSLSARYLQGAITAADGLVEEDVVAGEALVAFRPVQWVAIATGPQARALVRENGTERWVFWKALLHTEAALVGPVRGYLDAWRALASDVNVLEPLDHAQGIEGGISAAFGRLPITLHARYRAERISLAGGARLETIERIAVGLTLGPV